MSVTSYDVGDFGVPLISPAALYSEPDKAPGKIADMQRDAAAEVQSVSRASAQAEADARQAAGEMEEAQRELGAQDVTASDAFNPILDLAAVAVAASPGGILAAAPIFAASALNTGGYFMSDRSSKGGEGENSGGEQTMTADEWVMRSSRARKIEVVSNPGQNAGPQEGYNRVEARPVRIDLSKAANADLDMLKTENMQGRTHFASSAETDGSKSASVETSHDSAPDMGQIQELQARIMIAQASISGVSGIRVASGKNNEEAFSYGEKLKSDLGLNGPDEMETPIPIAPTAPMSMAA